jgi:hypothetical protein
VRPGRVRRYAVVVQERLSKWMTIVNNRVLRVTPSIHAIEGLFSPVPVYFTESEDTVYICSHI